MWFNRLVALTVVLVHCAGGIALLWLLQKPALVQASVDASGFRENSDGRSAVPKGRAFTMVPFAVVTF